MPAHLNTQRIYALVTKAERARHGEERAPKESPDGELFILRWMGDTTATRTAAAAADKDGIAREWVDMRTQNKTWDELRMGIK